MKKIIKYMALFAIVAMAAKAFVEAFTPEYELWKEKYPADPEDSDEESPSDVAAHTIEASELFTVKKEED